MNFLFFCIKYLLTLFYNISLGRKNNVWKCCLNVQFSFSHNPIENVPNKHFQNLLLALILEKITVYVINYYLFWNLIYNRFLQTENHSIFFFCYYLKENLSPMRGLNIYIVRTTRNINKTEKSPTRELFFTYNLSSFSNMFK